MHHNSIKETRLHSSGLLKTFCAHDEKMLHCIFCMVHFPLGSPCDISNGWCKERGKAVLGREDEAFPRILQ